MTPDGSTDPTALTGEPDLPAAQALGTSQIVFLVISAAAPLTGMLGAVPPAISFGNGAGVPGAYVIAGLLLLLFSVGYASMSRHVVRAGAFYAYVAAGLGRPLGMAAALVALLSYTAVQLGLYGLFGFFCTVILNPVLHIDPPWYAYALPCVLVVQVTGVRGIDLNARVLGVLMVLELAILLILSLAIVVHGGGPDGLTAAPFSPARVSSGHPGIAIMFAFASFIGFEATALYGRECREPAVVIPRSTYLSVSVILAFFAFVTWAIVVGYGMEAAVRTATSQPGEFWFIQADARLGAPARLIMSVLLLTSIFASILSFHNTIARYVRSLSVDGVLPPALARLHPVHRSPYRASGLQTVVSCLVLLVFVLARSDPYSVLFSWMSALGTLGIVALQTVTSFAISAYLRKTGADTRLWHSLIAPVLAGIGLAAVGVLLIANLGVLSGSDSSVVNSFPWIILVVAALGVATSFSLRRRDRQAYDKFGQ